MGSSSSHHDSAPTSPALPQAEALYSPGNSPASPQQDVQEPSTGFEKSPSPTQDTRNEVNLIIIILSFPLNRPLLIRQ